MASKATDWNKSEIFEALELALKEAESDGKTADTRKQHTVCSFVFQSCVLTYVLVLPVCFACVSCA